MDTPQSETGTERKDVGVIKVLNAGIDGVDAEVHKSGTHESTWRICLQYKRALFWSAFISMASIMWGYDVLLSNGTISIPAFQQDFGILLNGGYIISSQWQILFNSAASMGGFVGCLVTGYIADKLGRRLTMAIASLVSITGVFIQVFAHDQGTILAGKLINGLSMGTFLTLPSLFSSEIAPVPIRGVATSTIQFFIGFGQLLANLVLKATGTLDSNLAYKIPFALQFIFPVILLLGLPFCPESPWHLLRHGQLDKATNALVQLGYADPVITLATMAETLEHEKSLATSTTYLSCFRGSDLRRTEIACGVFAVCQFTGVVFVIGYSSYFFELGGLSASTSFSLSVAVSILGLVGVVLSWFLINTAGRRSSFLTGTIILTILVLLIGIFDLIPPPSSSKFALVYAQTACIIIFNCIYFLTVGPMGWAIFAEIPSARLRARTVALAVVVQNLFGILLNIVVPLLINPDAANLKGKIGFIFAGTSAVCVVWVWARVPETKGRSFGELDALFERGVSSRKFSDDI